MEDDRSEACGHISSKIDVIEVLVNDVPTRGFVLTHEWAKPGQRMTGKTTPVVLSTESLRGLVEYLQRALVTAGTVSSPPKRVQ